MKWETVKLGDAATFINGYAFKPTQWAESGRKIIRIQDLTSGSSQTNFFDGEIDAKYRVKRGDLLISWSATLGVFEWQEEDAWLNQHIFKVEFNKLPLNKLFFSFLIKHSLK
ncbi:restriction endonuclease subunit S, partial [Prolixibacteraceae bacterium]|nr:restriction endonuclease subunit S [Prolixibacteraceae bacterium]